MIEVRGQQDRFLACARSLQNADNVPGRFSWHLREAGETASDVGRKSCRQWRLLQESSILTARLQTEAGEQRGNVNCREMLVTGPAPAPLQFVGGKKVHVCVDAGDAKLCRNGFPDLALADGNRQRRIQKCLG